MERKGINVYSIRSRPLRGGRYVKWAVTKRTEGGGVHHQRSRAPIRMGEVSAATLLGGEAPGAPNSSQYRASLAH